MNNLYDFYTGFAGEAMWIIAQKDAHLLCAKSQQLRLLLISICKVALASDGFLFFEEN
jgi:hypothetical protein